MFEPFHELYPQQCALFFLQPVFVTLRSDGGKWTYDMAELVAALDGAVALVLVREVVLRRRGGEALHLCPRRGVQRGTGRRGRPENGDHTQEE